MCIFSVSGRIYGTNVWRKLGVALLSYIYNVCVVFGDPGKGKNKLQCEVKGNTWSNAQFFTGWNPVFQGSITLKMLSIQAIFLEFKR